METKLRKAFALLAFAAGAVASFAVGATVAYAVMYGGR
jgi:hypothetical protein